MMCEECAGIWFTRDALRPPSLDPSALPEASRKPAPTARRQRKIRVCPICSRHLEAERVEGVEIDRCSHCAGVWLDAGEYAAVRKRIEIQPGKERRTEPGKGLHALDGFDGVIQLIGEAINLFL